MEPPRLLRLSCAVKNYEWGRLGDDSLVARLAARNSAAEDGGTDPCLPYAELWMGTHESGPSLVLAGDESNGGNGSGGGTLKEWLRDHPAALGDRVAQRWGGDLPFLFKVLSVAKALSIQAHPDKTLAERLHAARPELYRDANHKPEMAVAITEFRALCGFVSLKELKDVFIAVPEIIDLVGMDGAFQLINCDEHNSAEVKLILQSVFTKLMSASEDAVSEAISRLKTRLDAVNKVRPLTEKEQLVLALEKQYPNDIGVISAFFFNYIKLRPGQALYLDANEPHAYLSGECVECMATSDNVVRAGLTPKYKDVPTLCSMLTYKQVFPEILPGEAVKPFVTRYTPPFDEFEVEHCLIPLGESVDLPANTGPSILLVVSGMGKIAVEQGTGSVTVAKGDVFFQSAESQVRVSDSETGALQLFRASVNRRAFL